MISRPSRLRVGDIVRFDGHEHEIVGLDGATVILRTGEACTSALTVAALMADATFEILGSPQRRRTLVPTYFESLPNSARQRALWLEGHVSEVLDGVPLGSQPGTPPRPEYDVTRTTLRQRELAKVVELQRSGQPIALGVLQEYRRRYARAGVAALIDKRALRRSTLTGRVDERYLDALQQVLTQNTAASTGTSTRLKRLVDKAVEHEHGVNVVPIPSQRTFDRLRKRMAQARHATGSARTRRSLANQPDAPFGTVTATRPGEWMQIDSTPFDVGIRLDDQVSGRIELTGLIDVHTRTICAAVLRPTTKAVDAALLLAKAMLPEPMRPGWPQAISMAYSALPFQLMRSVDERLQNAAARPVIVPENIVCDNNKAFISTTFLNACRTLGISLQRAHPFTPTDKPIIERTLESVKTLFAQYVTGYLGSSTDQRGRNADKDAVFSLIELQDLLDEWIVTGWQHRKHDGLRDPLNPTRVLTPNEMYAASVAITGYVAVPLTADDYIGLLPMQHRKINSYGVKIEHRVYDTDELNPYRGQPSGVKELRDGWAVHYDPYDVTRVWVRNHYDGGWITALWRQLHTPPQPFGEAAWRCARDIAAQRGITGPSEDTIKAALDDLLDRVSPPSPEHPRRKKSAVARRVAARTKATAHLPAMPEPSSERQATQLAPESADSDDKWAAVVPLPVFDPYKEAQSWW